MFKSYLKLAWRNILRNKFYSLINVSGLAVGICACIVIYLIVSYELDFDTFHPDKERIYKVMSHAEFRSGDKFDMHNIPFAAVLNGRKELTGLQDIAGLVLYNAKIEIADNGRAVKKFSSKPDNLYYPTTIVAEPQYFDIFKYKWLAGTPGAALNNPFSVVLTKNKAEKYFGSIPAENMIGKEVTYDDSLRVKVTGIIEEWKGNTDFAFTDFISYKTLESSFLKKSLSDDWNHMSTWAFVKLTGGTRPEQVNRQMAVLVKKYAPANPDMKLNFWLEPLTRVHFNGDVVENPVRTANLPDLYTLIGISLFILILAIINFINLSTAQSIRRAKEIGVRKVLGSRKTGITFQFLTETFIVTAFALFTAVLLVYPVLFIFGAFIPQGVTFNIFSPATVVFLFIVLLVTALLAGIYPAKVLASYLPVASLKGEGAYKGGGKWWLRKALIVFQFSVSLAFIICCLVINRQLQYTRTKDMGFAADAVAMVSTPQKYPSSKVRLLEERLKRLPGIAGTALQMNPPLGFSDWNIPLKFKSINDDETRIQMLAGSENFIPLYQMKLLAGRNLLKSDSLKEFVINETFLHMLGFKNPSEALGKMLYYSDKPYPIVGVVEDFNEKSFRETIKPICIVNIPDQERTVGIKLAVKGRLAGNAGAVLADMEKIWKEVYPGEDFNYRFFDQTIALFYEKDYRTAKLMNAAMLVTVFLSCIGLFGLAMFTTGKRRKEIGIRKVFGASAANIAIMLSKEFVKLVLLGFLVASPVAWYFMQQWLQSFVYRISLSWWLFAASGLVAVLIAIATVGYQSVSAAISNPVKNLRAE